MEDREYKQILDDAPEIAQIRQEYKQILDDAPEFVDSEPPILTAEEPVVRIKGTEAEDKLLQWTGQQRR